MNILTQLLQIIALRRKPQDIDYDAFSAVFYVVAAVGLGYLINNATSAYSKPLQYSLVQNLSHVAALYGLLVLNKKQNRFVQTCTTLFGVSVILQFISLGTTLSPVFAALSLFFVIWGFYLSILILKAALDTTTLSAILIVIALGFISVSLVAMIYPSFLEEFMSIVESAKQQSA